MTVNPYKLNAKERRIFFEKRCKHSHLFSTHPACFEKEILKDNLKRGVLDIETTGFEANYHHMLTWVIKTMGKEEYFTACITKEDLDSGKFDKRLCKELIKTLNKYDVIYTYYGTGFDIPFIRARCLKYKLNFPGFGYIKHKDIYYMVRGKLKLNRKSLAVATNFLGIKGKNHVLGEEWMLARLGNKDALDYVLKHNILDCQITEKLFYRLENYDKGTVKSM